MVRFVPVSIYEIVGSGLCVASTDGEKVYEQINRILTESHGVSLSFSNLETLTSTFLNSAIGQLYSKFEYEFVDSHLIFEDIEDADLALVDKVTANAKLFFKDPKRIIEANKRAEGESGK